MRPDPQTTGGNVAMSRICYSQTPVHVTVRAVLHPGSVKLRWFRVRDCEAATAGVTAAMP